MNELGTLAEKGKLCLEEGQSDSNNLKQLCAFISRNFAIRREMYGDDVVGYSNIAAIELANE